MRPGCDPNYQTETMLFKPSLLLIVLLSMLAVSCFKSGNEDSMEREAFRKVRKYEELGERWLYAADVVLRSRSGQFEILKCSVPIEMTHTMLNSNQVKMALATMPLTNALAVVLISSTLGAERVIYITNGTAIHTQKMAYSFESGLTDLFSSNKFRNVRLVVESHGKNYAYKKNCFANGGVTVNGF